MKKQFLFLILFVAAILVGTSNAFAQYLDDLDVTDVANVGCVDAAPLNCAVSDDALNPIPGKVYTYAVTVNAALTAAGNGAVHWFVTDQTTFVDGTTPGAPVLQPSRDAVDGTYVLTAGSEYNNPTDPTVDIDIDISWKYFDPTLNVFLVAYVTDEAGCTDNIEVYKIEPSFGFTLDIAGMLDNGTVPVDPNAAEECASPVESASWASDLLTVDYGENWIFYSVNAANFNHSWQPSFTTAIAGATSALSDVEWAYPAEAFGTGATWHAATEPVMAQAAGGAVGTDGECIVLRVRVDHGIDNEIDVADGPAVVTVGVNGIMYDPTGAGSYTNTALTDLDNNPSGNAADPCVTNVTDEADYTITPRPEVQTNTEPANSTKDPFENKTGD